MHEVAEYGVAAHWLYKEGGDQDIQFENKMSWVRKLLDWQRDADGAVEFVESFKTDIFQNQIHVYTPKGDVIELPVGATPLDFAYRIHTDIGHSCVGAKVNGKLVSLKYKLKNGDNINIMNTKATSGPSVDWLNESSGYISTTSARAKIRQFFNKQERQGNLERGKEIFQRQIKRLDIIVTSQESADLLKFQTDEDMFVALGDGTLTWAKFTNRINLNDAVQIKTTQAEMPKFSSGVEVLGVGDLLTSIARCCNPVLGDKILGFITRGRGVTIHRVNCSSIINEDEPERIVVVDWGETKPLSPVRIQVIGWDRVGLLLDVASTVSSEKINITDMSSESKEDDSVISFTVYVTGISQLNILYARLESITGIISVSRLSNLENFKKITT
jgi:GTP pyrophosphokinase